MGMLLNDSERKRIADAVTEAERLSGGEIVTAVTAESDDYGFRELLFAVIVGFLVFNAEVFAGGPLERLFSSLFWGFDTSLLPFFYGALGLAAGTIAYFLAQIPAVDRLIVSRKMMERAVRNRAHRHFMESGVYDTLDRTGILLFVSLLERRVELVADRGINEKVPAETWNSIVTELTSGISRGNLGEALARAVTECGAVLAEHIERRQNDTNELGDAPEELGSGS